MRPNSQIAPRVDRSREIRRLIGRRRATLPLLKIWPAFRSGEVVSSSTDFCVEGFPFSANTFAYCSVLDSNPLLRGAHHTHQPGQVLAAVSRGIPTALVIRNPLDAVESIAIFDGGVAAAHHFLGVYIGFHRRLHGVIERGGVVVCPFDRVIADVSYTVQALNSCFAIDLETPRSSAQDLLTSSQKMRNARGMLHRSTYEDDLGVGLEDLRAAIRDDAYAPEAIELYQRMRSYAPSIESVDPDFDS